MNEWSNDQAHVEGWRLDTGTNTVRTYGWEFVLVESDGKTPSERAVEHVEKQARAGSAYHIEALAQHYFRE